MRDENSNSTGSRRFQLGRRQLGLAAGFVVTVLVCEFALGLTPYRVMVPAQVEQNQLQMLAHLQRPVAEDVLILGSSRVLEGVEPNLISRILSFQPDRPINAVRLPVQGIRSWAVTELVRDLVVPQPPHEMLVIGLEARFFYYLPGETARPLGFQMLATTADLFTTDLTQLKTDQLRELTLAPFRGVRAPWILPAVFLSRTAEYVKHLHEQRGLPVRNLHDLSRREFEMAVAMRDEIAEQDARIEDQELVPFDVAAFDELLDLCESLPCRVAFVRLPVTPEFDRDQWRQLEAYEKEIVGRLLARGFDYHDLNLFGQLRVPELFQNPSHLNEQGMALASRVMALAIIGPAVLGAPPHGAAIPIPAAQPGTGGSNSPPAPPIGVATGMEELLARAGEVRAQVGLSESQRRQMLRWLRVAAEAAAPGQEPR